MNYGLPYMGSKSAIAPKLIAQLPHNDNFYDIFAGGCSMTHAAMLSHKWQHFFANDITDAPLLFKRATQGEFTNETRWISRETFFNEKDHDPYVRLCWSFGNNQRDYLYSRTIEPYKKACHYAVVLDDWGYFKELCPEVYERTKEALDNIADTKQRRITFGSAIVKELKRIGDMDMVENNPLYKSCHWKGGKNARSLQSLERLQRLQSLESLERLQRLEITQLSYDKLDIKPKSTVYADPPYQNTNKYITEFNHEDFFQWARTRPYPVFISEYNAPSDFKCIWQTNKSCSLSATATNKTIERLFVYKSFNNTAQQLTLF